jgi:hypothetical protein
VFLFLIVVVLMNLLNGLAVRQVAPRVVYSFYLDLDLGFFAEYSVAKMPFLSSYISKKGL